jgi:hypothetical protein
MIGNGGAARRLGLSAALVSALVSGCWSREVTAADVTGTWVVDRESRGCLSKAQQQARLTLVMNADGTFSATVGADLLSFLPPTRDGVVSGGGAWTLYDHYNGRRAVQLVFRWLDPARRVPYGTFLEARASGPRTVLAYFRGDPDEGIVVEFEKVR